jgi:deoxyribodipyrimidine photolyase-related protein
MNPFVILPHQLYNKKYLNKKDQIILWEHPHYFLSHNFNQKKLMLHRASMKYYYDYLKDAGFKVKYLEFQDKFPNISDYTIFDPIDKIDLPNNPEVIESPNFLLTKDLYEEYRKTITEKFFFKTFYEWGKKQINVIPNVKSKDKDNRLRIPPGTIIPKLPTNKSDDEYIKEAAKYVTKHFGNNYGNVENFIFPVSHKVAKTWLKNFIEKKFKDFGPYEDFIDTENNYLFHSILSSSINIGLINPSDIIKEITKYKTKIPINSYEGYVRQLFWREYQRFIYIYNDLSKLNYFGHKNKLTKSWYTGKTGIDPIDHNIKLAFDTGYLHHIERLMVIGNFMSLSGIDPREGHKWFMEFAIDSYLWVMHQNVYDMVFFVTGGKTMRRPYMSSSNYILTMSNFKRGEWVQKWNNLYDSFLKNNKTKLWKFRYFFRGLK